MEQEEENKKRTEDIARRKSQKVYQAPEDPDLSKRIEQQKKQNDAQKKR